MNELESNGDNPPYTLGMFLENQTFFNLLFFGLYSYLPLKADI